MRKLITALALGAMFFLFPGTAFAAGEGSSSLELSATTVAFIIATMIPIAVGFLTKLESKYKGPLMIVLNAGKRRADERPVGGWHSSHQSGHAHYLRDRLDRLLGHVLRRLETVGGDFICCSSSRPSRWYDGQHPRQTRQRGSNLT